MKKYISVLLASLLIFSNVSLASAQELNIGVEKASIPPSETILIHYLQPKPTEWSFQNIPSIARKFGVSETWIYNEMAKGYTLEHINKGLEEQKLHGRSYEMVMSSLYPNIDGKIRTKRALPVLAVPLITATIRAAAPAIGRAAVATTMFFSGPVGKPNRKGQGREGNEKKRTDSSWKPNPNKNINRDMKKHTPSPKHKGGKK